MLRRFSIRRNIRFTLLSDLNSEIIKAFGLDNEGYAHPIIFIVDNNGKITKRFSALNYTDRPSVDAVIGSLR